MAIFGNSYAAAQEEEIQLENMNGTDEEFLSIMAESYKDSYKLEAGMYVADAIMEQQVLTEGANPEVLLEGFMGDFWAKTKAFFKKMWEKIKSWFNGFIRAFKILVLSGEKFIKEFETELNRKVDSGYEYQSYKYKNISEVDGAIENLVSMCESEIDKRELGKEVRANAETKDLVEKLDADMTSMYKGFGGDTQEECIKAVKTEVLGDKEECKDFDNLSKAAMIARVKGLSKTLKEVDAGSKKIDTFFKKIIKYIESTEKWADNMKGTDASAHVKAVNATVAHYKKVSSFLSVMIKAVGELHKTIAADCQSVLKGYLRFKPVKESATTSAQGTSILESAMAYV